MTLLIESTRRDGVMRKGEWRCTQGVVVVCCPECGKICPLLDYTIDQNGTVTPSLACPFKCDFHEFVLLADWRA